MRNRSGALIEGRLRHAFTRARTIVEGLSDDEFFWEPVEGCWSIRPHAEVPDEYGVGVGDWRIEFLMPPPEPPPMTTIGWRLVHLAASTDTYRSFGFEERPEDLRLMQIPGTAVEAVEWLEQAHNRFIDAVALLAPKAFDELRPTHWGGRLPLSSIIGVIELEHIHHGAEISLLRDLHRGRAQILVWPPPPR